MPSEKEHIEFIQSTLTEEGFASNDSLRAVEIALQEHPHSVQLWCLRGTLIQLDNGGDNVYQLDDALASYRKAIELDPGCAQAYEEIGHFHDAILDEPEQAQAYFQKSHELQSKNAA